LFVSGHRTAGTTRLETGVIVVLRVTMAIRRQERQMTADLVHAL